MTAGDGGYLPATVFLSSQAVVGRYALIYKLRRDGQMCAVPSVLATTRTALLSPAIRRDSWPHWLMESVDIVPAISQMPQRTSGPGISHIGLLSMKRQLNASMSSLEPAAHSEK